MESETVVVNGTEFTVTIKDSRCYSVTVGSIVLFDHNDYGYAMNARDTIGFLKSY